MDIASAGVELQIEIVQAVPVCRDCLIGQTKQSALSVIHLCICLDLTKCRPFCAHARTLPPHSRCFSFVDHLVYSEKPWILASQVNKFHSLIRLACVQSKQCYSNSFLIKTVVPSCY